jgi:type VI secretion system protein ImpF
MAEITAADRLYPALLDRLSDDEPSKKTESMQARAASMSRLRESVLRDLNWLFNAGQTSLDLDEYPEVAKSVINFGLPTLSGLPASSLKLGDLARALREILIQFEPRLIPSTVRVQAVAGEAVAHNVIAFRIEATMWSQPVPLELLLRTDIDLESGQTRVVESAPA